MIVDVRKKGKGVQDARTASQPCGSSTFIHLLRSCPAANDSSLKNEAKMRYVLTTCAYTDHCTQPAYNDLD